MTIHDSSPSIQNQYHDIIDVEKKINIKTSLWSYNKESQSNNWKTGAVMISLSPYLTITNCNLKISGGFVIQMFPNQDYISEIVHLRTRRYYENPATKKYSFINDGWFLNLSIFM